MLDLKKLRREIDEALEKETEESLTSWLLAKRSSNVESYIGEGVFMPCEFNSLHSSAQIVTSAHGILMTEIITEVNSSAGNTQYAMAA